MTEKMMQAMNGHREVCWRQETKGISKHKKLLPVEGWETMI